jgi:hypothetical protein
MSHPASPAARPWLLATLAASALLPLPLVACSSSPARVDFFDRAQETALETYRHRGRDYVVGAPGNEYAIRIRNCSGRRILAVVSVDGVNVVTGETAAPDQSGYVIEPYGYVNVQGWRKDLERTAAFYFSDPSDAYATRTGRPDDLGVIGVAVFRERELPPRTYPFESKVANAPPAAPESAAGATAQRGAAESAAADAALPSLGTGHGRREWSPAQRVEFERAGSRPDQRVVIRYDRRETLAALGVLPRPSWRGRDPDPFPGTLGFVPDP